MISFFLCPPFFFSLLRVACYFSSSYLFCNRLSASLFRSFYHFSLLSDLFRHSCFSLSLSFALCKHVRVGLYICISARVCVHMTSHTCRYRRGMLSKTSQVSGQGFHSEGSRAFSFLWKDLSLKEIRVPKMRLDQWLRNWERSLIRTALRNGWSN